MAAKEWVCGRCFTRLLGEIGSPCGVCGATDLVPVESPRGQQILASVQPVPSAPAMRMPLPKIPREASICSNCYLIGVPKSEGPGAISGLMVVATAIWGIFFWPAWIITLLFAIYMAAARKTVCKGCGNQGTLVPHDSPRALELVERKVLLETSDR